MPEHWYVAYYVPALRWMRNYSWDMLPGDVLAGMTLASFQIPLSLSYAKSLAHVSAVSGLWGFIIPPTIYALFGSVPQMVVGPEAAISLVVGQNVAPYLHPGKNHEHRSHLEPSEVAGLLSATVGIIVLMFGLLRAGFLERVVSPSLLRGFISGVGLIMITDQLPAQLGIGPLMRKTLPPDASSYQKFVFTLQNLHLTHGWTAAFSFSALFAMAILKYGKKVGARKNKTFQLLPEILLVVIASTIVSWVGSFGDKGLDLVGDVKARGVKFEWMLRPSLWADFKLNFSSGFFIAILGFLESTVASRALGRDDINVSSNRELVALGLVNIGGSFAKALPAFGGYGRSKVNAMSGAKSQMSAFVMSAVTVVTAYFLMGFVYYLPECVLSSIITTVGVSLLEEAPSDIRFYVKVRGFSDLTTIAVSAVASFLWSVQAGVALGAFVALVRVLHHATRPRIQILTKNPETREWVNADEVAEDFEDVREVFPIDSGILIIRIPEPLTFANCGDLSNRLRRLELHRTNKVHPAMPAPENSVLHHAIFQLNGMTSCDAGAAAILRDVIKDYYSRNIVVLFVAVPSNRRVKQMLSHAGIFDLVSTSDQTRTFFDTIDQALATFDTPVGSARASILR